MGLDHSAPCSNPTARKPRRSSPLPRRYALSLPALGLELELVLELELELELRLVLACVSQCCGKCRTHSCLPRQLIISEEVVIPSHQIEH